MLRRCVICGKLAGTSLHVANKSFVCNLSGGCLEELVKRYPDLFVVVEDEGS